jgi:hypothetical protein
LETVKRQGEGLVRLWKRPLDPLGAVRWNGHGRGVSPPSWGLLRGLAASLLSPTIPSMPLSCREVFTQALVRADIPRESPVVLSLHLACPQAGCHACALLHLAFKSRPCRLCSAVIVATLHPLLFHPLLLLPPLHQHHLRRPCAIPLHTLHIHPYIHTYVCGMGHWLDRRFLILSRDPSRPRLIVTLSPDFDLFPSVFTLHLPSHSPYPLALRHRSSAPRRCIFVASSPVCSSSLFALAHSPSVPPLSKISTLAHHVRQCPPTPLPHTAVTCLRRTRRQLNSLATLFHLRRRKPLLATSSLKTSSRRLAPRQRARTGRRGLLRARPSLTSARHVSEDSPRVAISSGTSGFTPASRLSSAPSPVVRLGPVDKTIFSNSEFLICVLADR